MPDDDFYRDHRPIDWFFIDNPVIDDWGPKIGPYGFFIYCVLVKHSRNGSPALSHAEIGQEVRCSVSTVQKAINELIKYGLIRKKKKSVKEEVKPNGKPNIYEILRVPLLPEKIETTANLVVFAPRERRLNPDDPEEGSVLKTDLRAGGSVSPHRRVGIPTPTSASEILSLSELSLKTSTTAKTKTKTSVSDEPPLLLPAWLDVETWEAYLAMRKANRKPATRYACQIILRNLARFEAAGLSSKLSLEQSITAGWTDVYEPKGERINGNGNVSARTQRNRNNLSEVLDWIDGLRPGEGQDEASSGGGDGNGRSDGY
jgi:DNA-binding Lrp family transcriptional regulator